MPEHVHVLESRVLLSSVPQGFVDEQVTGGLHYPAGMAAMQDGRILVCEQGGTLRVIKNGQLLPQPMVTVAVDNLEERGLANVAVDPEFDTNGYIYLWYTATPEPTPQGPKVYNRLVRYTVSGDEAIAASATLLFQTEALAIPIHNAGAMAFGPDGKLYFTHGHGWYGQEPQSLECTFGKILRINPDGTIPEDNPFYEQTTGRNRAIWAVGFRNPYSMSFNPANGALVVSDVGGASWEEVNEVAAGANHGWPLREGVANDPNFIDPVYAYDHSQGIAIIGATFYNPQVPIFPEAYRGKFFFGDFAAGWIRMMDPQTHEVSNFATGLPNYRTAMAVSDDGSLYYTDRDAPGEFSALRRIRYTDSQSPNISQQPQSQSAAAGESVDLSVSVTGTGPFKYQWRKDNVLLPGKRSATLELPDVSSADNGAYTCIVISDLGAVVSDPATLSVINGARPQIDIALPTVGTTFRGGDTITFEASATDSEDGAMQPSAVNWQVEFGHDTHKHPFIAPTTGSSGSFVVSDAGEPDPDVYYLITVSATDSSGLKQTATRRIDPLLSQVTLASNIPGITLQLDGQPHASPYTFSGVENFRRLITAPTTQDAGDDLYLFTGWSNGGAQSQELVTPISDATITANYRKVTPTYLSDLTAVSESNGLGPIERDTNNGTAAPNDGGPITLNGKVYSKGLGMYGPAEISFNLNKGYTRFFATLGIDDLAGDEGSVYYEVWLDGTRVYQSPLVRGITTSIPIDIPVAGKDEMTLKVVDETSRVKDYADWADAFLLAAPAVVSGAVQVDGAMFSIQLQLNQDFGDLLHAEDFTLTNLGDTSTIPLTADNLQYTAAGNLLNVVFPEATNTLPVDGNYQLVLDQPQFIDADGQSIALHFEQLFFVLQGDANRDRIVDTQDFNILAENFGGESKVFSQGDFNYSTTVDSIDFDVFVTQYGKRIAPASTPPVASNGSRPAGVFGNLRLDTADRLDLLD